MTFKTEQEAFWAGEFGTEYIQRNQGDALLASNLDFFAKALRATRGVKTCIEFGANIGMALGGVMGAFSFDITGSYTAAIWLSAGFSLAGAFSIAVLQPTRRLLIPDWDKESENLRTIPEVPMEPAASGSGTAGD